MIFEGDVNAAPGFAAQEGYRLLHMKCTAYFAAIRNRPDRLAIRDEWIRQAISTPSRETLQSDGRIRRWTFIAEKGRFLRVVLLSDGETVHYAFFDRGFKP